MKLGFGRFRKCSSLCTGLHWITLGIFDIVAIMVLGWALSPINRGQGIRLSTNELIGNILASVVIS